jgi:hypothetical protein
LSKFRSSILIYEALQAMGRSEKVPLARLEVYFAGNYSLKIMIPMCKDTTSGAESPETFLADYLTINLYKQFHDNMNMGREIAPQEFLDEYLKNLVYNHNKKIMELIDSQTRLELIKNIETITQDMFGKIEVE